MLKIRFRSYLVKLAAIILLSATLFYSKSSAQSDDREIEVNIRAGFDPSSTVALLVSASGTLQVEPSRVERIGDYIVVGVPYKPAEIPRDSMVSAMSVSPSGEIAYADVRSVFSSEPKESFLRVPACTPKKVSEMSLQGQLSLLESLVEIRAARRNVAQVKVNQLLTDKFLQDLTRLEKGFGLTYPSELSPNLSPVELNDRLFRILEAIKTVKNRR